MLEPVLPVVMQSMQDRPIREESEEILWRIALMNIQLRFQTAVALCLAAYAHSMHPQPSSDHT